MADHGIPRNYEIFYEFLGELYKDVNEYRDAVQDECEGWEWLEEYTEESLARVGVSSDALGGHKNLYARLDSEVQSYLDIFMKDVKQRSMYAESIGSMFDITLRESIFEELECGDRDLAIIMWIACLKPKWFSTSDPNILVKIIEASNRKMVFQYDFDGINSLTLKSEEQLRKGRYEIGKITIALDEYKKELKVQRDKFDVLSKAYEEQLTLQKPSEYWNNRKKNCRNAALGGVVAFALLFAMSTGILWFLYLNLEIADKGTFHLGKGVIFTSATVVLMYMMTQVVKFTMGNYHTAYEADEKIVMIESYISLLAKEQITPEERKFLFENLFRLSDSGFIKSGGDNPASTNLVQQILKQK